MELSRITFICGIAFISGRSQLTMLKSEAKCSVDGNCDKHDYGGGWTEIENLLATKNRKSSLH